MPGPQPKLTKSKANAILVSLQSDRTLAEACDFVGISLSAYYRNIDRYPDILEAIKKVFVVQKLIRRESAIEAIKRSFDKNWQAAAWWLERNYPDEFGRAAPRVAQNDSELIIMHVDANGNPVDGLPIHLQDLSSRGNEPKQLEPET